MLVVNKTLTAAFSTSVVIIAQMVGLNSRAVSIPVDARIG